MDILRANESRFNFSCATAGLTGVAISAGTITEGLSRAFELTIDLVLDNTTIVSDCIGAHASLSLSDGSTERHIYGVISCVDTSQRANLGGSCRLTIEPRLGRLARQKGTRISSTDDVPDLLAQIGRRANLPDDWIRIDLQQPHRIESGFSVQYQETDLSFLKRTLEHHGAAFRFDHSRGIDTVVVTDRLPTGAEPIRHFARRSDQTLSTEPSRSVFNLRLKHSLMPSSVLLRDSSGGRISSCAFEQEQSPSGTVFEFGEGCQDPSLGKRLALTRMEELNCQRTVLTGETYSTLMEPGHVIEISGLPSEQANRYLIVQAESVLSQVSLHGLPTQPGAPAFVSKFMAIPVDIPFRPQRCTPVPTVPGVLTARLESPLGSPFIDKNGHYRARFDFDTEASDRGNASPPLRMAQPFAGSQSGLHFPNHEGTEVLLAFVNGNPNRPIVLGALHNPDPTAIVTQDNRQQNRIKTSSGHEMLLDDTSKDAAVHLVSAGGHKVSLEDAACRVTVTSVSGHALQLDDEASTVLLQTSNGHSIRIDDEAGRLNLSSVDGAVSLSLDLESGHVALQTSDGSIHLKAPNGDVAIACRRFTVAAEDGIALESGGTLSSTSKAHTMIETTSDLLLVAGGDIDRRGNGLFDQARGSVDIKAGSKTTVSAETTIALKAPDIDIKAELKLGAKAPAVDISADGTNTITGKLVKIN